QPAHWLSRAQSDTSGDARGHRRAVPSRKGLRRCHRRAVSLARVRGPPPDPCRLRETAQRLRLAAELTLRGSKGAVAPFEIPLGPRRPGVQSGFAPFEILLWATPPRCSERLRPL